MMNERDTCTCGHTYNEHKTQPSGAVACCHFGCGCSDFDKRRERKLTRQEHLEGLADSGCDTWEEYRGER